MLGTSAEFLPVTPWTGLGCCPVTPSMIDLASWLGSRGWVLVCHWSSPKALEAGWLNARKSKLEHNSTRQVTISARNPSDTKS